ncbi:MAG TPA: MAPEG family protein [Herbaspirillum sp.]|jgi:uncharacterized MAPEG superfamily protein
MNTELSLLAWTLVLALVQILLTAAARTRETGNAYNVGPRDHEGPPVGIVTGRLQRAQKNLFETLPLFAAAVLIAHIADRENALTLWGAWIYFLARIAYVPLYAAGVPVLRTLVWTASLVGLCMVFYAIVAAQ